MRYALLALTVLVLPAPALAQAEASSTSMNCAAAASLVRERGAVVFNVGTANEVRAVLDAASCEPGQKTNPLWIRTSDQPQCLVGGQCAHEGAVK